MEINKNMLFFATVLSFSLLVKQELPAPGGYVNDYADVIPEEQEQSMEFRLREYASTTSIEIAVLTVESLDGQTVERYAQNVFDEWGIGEREFNSGILLLVAPNDRKVRIHTGYGVEGELTDARASRIIDQKIIPHFRSEDFAEGVSVGVAEIMGQLGDLPWVGRIEQREARARAAAEKRANTMAAAKSFFAIIFSGLLGGGLIYGLIRLVSRWWERRKLRRRVREKLARLQAEVPAKVEAVERARRDARDTFLLDRDRELLSGFKAKQREAKAFFEGVVVGALGESRRNPERAWERTSEAENALLGLDRIAKDIRGAIKKREKKFSRIGEWIGAARDELEEGQRKVAHIVSEGFSVEAVEPRFSSAFEKLQGAEEEVKKGRRADPDRVAAYLERARAAFIPVVEEAIRIHGLYRENEQRADALLRSAQSFEEEELAATEVLLETLKSQYPRTVWEVLDADWRNSLAALPTVEKRIDRVKIANALDNQDFDLAKRILDEVDRDVSRLDVLAQKARSIKEAQLEAARDLPQEEEGISELFSRAEQECRDSDVGQSTRRRLENLKSVWDNIRLPEGLEHKVDWVMVLGDYRDLQEGLEKVIRDARSDKAEAERKKKAAARRRRRRNSSYSSGAVAGGYGGGVGSSGGSSFGGFGGGMSGGGGASGSW